MAAWLALIDPVSRLIDKLIPDKEAAAKAKIELLKEENTQALQEMQTAMSAILAEAQSADPWTSRARPAFMYVFYFIIIGLVVIAPLLGIFFPQHMEIFFTNTAKGFAAIPEPMWWTFSAGYLGYTGMRGIEKKWRSQ